MLFLVAGIINLLLCIFVFTRINWFISSVCLINYFLQVIFHFLTSFTNHGIPNKENICPLEVACNEKINKENLARYENYKYCKICNILVLKHNNISHYDECNICVEGKVT